MSELKEDSLKVSKSDITESDNAIDPTLLRPLHITKRGDCQPGKLKQPSNGEFVCRPMRLGLGAAPISHSRISSSDKSNYALSDRVNDGTSERSSVKSSRPSMLSRLSQKLIPSSITFAQDNSSIQIKNVVVPQLRRKSTDRNGILDMVFAVCLVDFHHVRGPEILWWRSNYLKDTIPDQGLFKHLPFQALPDGSHLFTETFSNFNLVYDFRGNVSLDDKNDFDHFQGNPNHLETLFGCSCVRQIKTTDMSAKELARNNDITRSIVQKAVVVITRKQPIFTKIKEKLSIITESYFGQRDFDDCSLLDSLFDNLNSTFKLGDDELPLSIKRPQTQNSSEDLLREQRYEEQEEYFVNLNLRGILFHFKTNMLVILKALLLEKKVLIYSNNDLELLTQFQNNIIALIPNLLKNLDLCGSPLCDYTEKYSPLEKPSSLKTNDRMSMLRFFGLPLQIFSTKGSFWTPYLPLQQIDELEADTFMVGCSNLIIAHQLPNYKVDLLVNLDDYTVTYPTEKTDDLRLTQMDKKFISVLLSTSQREDAYFGSDDYIRYQFEDYIRGLLATTKYYQYVQKFQMQPPGFDQTANINLGDLKSYGSSFTLLWFATKNYGIWNATCDDLVFNFHTPQHIAVELSSGESGYFSGFLSSLKKSQTSTKTNTVKSGLYFSHTKEPQKFISLKESDLNESKVATENDSNFLVVESEIHSEPKTYWSWAFSKKGAESN